MNETRNTESQISTRGLDSEMEKKMTQTEINNKIKSLDVDTAHELKFALENLEGIGIDVVKDIEKVVKAVNKIKY